MGMGMEMRWREKVIQIQRQGLIASAIRAALLIHGVHNNRITKLHETTTKNKNGTYRQCTHTRCSLNKHRSNIPTSLRCQNCLADDDDNTCSIDSDVIAAKIFKSKASVGEAKAKVKVIKMDYAER